MGLLDLVGFDLVVLVVQGVLEVLLGLVVEGEQVHVLLLHFLEGCFGVVVLLLELGHLL